jgi:hypothetical protein
MTRLPFRARTTVLLIVAIAAILAIALHAPIPQSNEYHGFADRRTILGIPNFWNVLSNLPFLLIGLAGIWDLAKGQPTGAIPALRPAYFCAFGGVALVAFGSGYYHLAPSNATLTWDRLPMTVAFMSLFAIVVGEHIQPRLGARLLLPLLVTGAASVAYWHFSRQAGNDDLRPYIVVQFVPLLLVPLILLLFPSRLSGVGYLWALLLGYVGAKLLESIDAAVFAHGHLISGHTLKHLVAACAMYFFLLAIRRRRPVSADDDVRPTVTEPARAA